MSKYDWLLFFHVTGAFLLIGGTVMGGAFSFAMLRRDVPSEILLLHGLTRVAVAAISAGVLLTIVFGLWLVDVGGYGYGEFWVVASLVLWVYANAAGGVGGRREKRTREFAARLVAEGDFPSAELRARVRDPVSLGLSYSSGVAILLILVLMIWKPGA